VVAASARHDRAIIGATRPEQVSENVKASGVKLSVDELAQIESILQKA
jgi:aryl-alcohol dehydrogenase-like predicted oxidoreductase